MLDETLGAPPVPHRRGGRGDEPSTPSASSPGSAITGSRPSTCSIAALADRHGLGVLHYDHDYDLIAEKTDLELESLWLAEPGSLEALDALVAADSVAVSSR